MTARSPSAFMLSALFHGALVVLILLLAYVANEHRPDAPKILELVAGPGNNYAATVAPALGVPGGIKVSVPTPPAPAPQPAPEPVPAPAPPPVAEVSPVAPAPIEKPKPADPAAPNFKRTIQRQIIRADSKAKAEIKKEREAEAKITKEQFDRENKAKAAAVKTVQLKVAKIDADGIKNGVVGGSTENKTGGASGKALTREEGTELEAYFSLLKSRLKENHEKPPGLSDTVAARVEFFVAADGSISRVRILRSSRSAEFDRSVLEAFARTKNIGPRPDHQSDMKELEFKMHDEDGG